MLYYYILVFIILYINKDTQTKIVKYLECRIECASVNKTRDRIEHYL